MASETMLLDMNQLRDCFAEVRTERDQLEQSIGRSLENLQALQRRLCQWHIDLCDSREELESERVRLAREAEEARQREQAHLADLARLESELAETRDAISRQTASDEQIDDLHLQQQDELRRLREQCQQLKLQQEQTQQELEAERQASHELRAALDTAHEGIASELEARLATVNEELERTRGGLDERNDMVHSLEQERAALETELEMVRTRAAELTEALDKERKQMAEDRAEWSNELKQLRRLLERQARLSATSLVGADVQVSPTAADDRETLIHGTRSPRRDDPVVGSVLAQFDRIRQQRVAARAAN